MPDVIVTANNQIGKISENVANLLKLGSNDGKGFRVQFIAPLTEDSCDANDLNEKAFFCIRALAQVQDLVTDKSWFDPKIDKIETAKANTAVLANLMKSDLFKHAEKLLMDNKASNDLKNAFKEQFSKQFNNGDMQELGERFSQIQKLNTKLACFFVPQKSI
jgi:hypothetical protein